MNNLIEKIAEKMRKIQIKCENRKKWKLYLYLNGQCIKCLKIDKDFAPMGKIYVVKTKGKKHLLGTNKKVQIVVRSYRYLYTDTKKRTSHIEVVLHEGVEINE